MPMRSKTKIRHLLDAGRPLLRTMCTRWIHPKQLTTTTKKIQLGINLLRHTPSVGVLGAALSHVVHRIATLALGKIVLRTNLRIIKTPLR